MVTKVFQSGNSQAIRLPKEFRVDVQEMHISQHGNVLILRPLRKKKTLAAAFDALMTIGDDFMPEGRYQGEMQERDSF